MNNKLLLIGSGSMSLKYWEVLQNLKIDPLVVGRGAVSANNFYKVTGCKVYLCPLVDVLNEFTFQMAIVSVSVDSLYETTLELIKSGVRKILVEKPAALSTYEIEKLFNLSNENKVEIFVAYNRRFYGSTLLAKEIIRHDGGILSAHFDFTELSHQIIDLDISNKVKQNWFLANSSHVIDFVFHMIGKPLKLESISSGSLSWHESSAIFAGHGLTEKGAIFSYHSNWNGPGRWMIELITKNHKLIFQPMESLKKMKIGSMVVEEVSPIDNLDQLYKPGLFRQVDAFINGDLNNLCSIKEHFLNWPYYIKIANYSI